MKSYPPGRTHIIGLFGHGGSGKTTLTEALLLTARAVARAGRVEDGTTVTVNAVAPGFIDTDMTASLNEAARGAALESIPLKRYGNAAEVAAVVCFLASDAAAYITGQTIAVDGGMVMS